MIDHTLDQVAAAIRRRDEMVTPPFPLGAFPFFPHHCALLFFV